MKKYKDRASILLDKAKKGDSAFTKQALTEHLLQLQYKDR